LKIDHPYARPTPPGARTAGVYFTIRNGGKEADRLVNAKTPAAQSAEIHSMTMQGNLMKMRQVPGVEIPAGGEVAFKSGGYHVMLVGVSHPLAVGDQVPLTLTFEKAGPVQVFANVEAANAKTQQEH
jgi:copper(I)-binding protein